MSARQIAASRYAEGSPCARGILSGQWDGGTVVAAALAEAEREALRQREEAEDE